MYAKELYPMLFVKKWPNPDIFLEKIQNIEHPFWGAGGAARTFAQEILLNGNQINWRFLAERIDDISVLVEVEMLKKLPMMIWKAHLRQNAMSKHIMSTEDLTRFLLDRYVSELKNILDPRYKHHIDMANFHLNVLYYKINVYDNESA